MAQLAFPFWHFTKDVLLEKLNTSVHGLSEREARRRLKRLGLNVLSRKRKRATSFLLLLAQFKSPLILLLLFAAAILILARNPSYSRMLFLARINLVLCHQNFYKLG